MYKFLGLVLLSALADVGAERTDLNDAVDRVIERINNMQRRVGTSSVLLSEIQLGPNVSYSGASFLGADSVKRTGDCWNEARGNDLFYHISYGFGLMTITLPHLEVAGTNMSAYARVRDNSFYLSYTKQVAQQGCQIRLHEIRLEKMENVDFTASSPKYDGANFDEFFKMVVMPALNDILYANLAKIESSLQLLCKIEDYQYPGNVQEIVRSLT